MNKAFQNNTEQKLSCVEQEAVGLLVGPQACTVNLMVLKTMRKGSFVLAGS